MLQPFPGSAPDRFRLIPSEGFINLDVYYAHVIIGLWTIGDWGRTR